MNAPDPAKHAETAAMSAEALIGLGITIGALGLLGLLLGWAQQMRSLPYEATFWFAVGAAAVVFGALIAGVARARRGPANKPE